MVVAPEGFSLHPKIAREGRALRLIDGRGAPRFVQMVSVVGGAPTGEVGAPTRR